MQPNLLITGGKLKLLWISSWGPLRLGNDGSYFYGRNLDLTGTNIFVQMFRDCSSLTSIPNINSWNISQITSISQMFYGCNKYNQNLNNWDTKKVW